MVAGLEQVAKRVRVLMWAAMVYCCLSVTVTRCRCTTIQLRHDFEEMRNEY